jgi:leucyl-tRNA synthetase
MTEDIEGNRYNTAIAAAMGAVNDLYKLKTEAFGTHDVWHEALASLAACIAPFAPHTGEELWHLLGHSTSVNHDSWPAFNEKYIATDMVTVAVQVNGKLRGTVAVAADSAEATAVEAANADAKISGYLAEGQIVKTIYVPGKLLNFVIK